MRKTDSKQKKTAVVLIHGIGNQAPLETLRGFVDAVWWQQKPAPGEEPREIWVKPDTVNEDYELRRITTNRNLDGRRIDFFEFYWAHLMEGTRFTSVLWWLKRLLFRTPTRVPSRVVSAWLAIGLGWLAALLAMLFSVGAFLTALRVLPDSFWEAVLWVVLAVAPLAMFWYIRHRVLVQVVGDAARYLTADPENINARSRIRQAGVALLRKLNDNPDYDRIVIVGHSLGTVVGYDMLSLAWSDMIKSLSVKNPASLKALTALESSAEALRKNPDPATRLAFQSTQHAYCAALQGKDFKGWKVSDFVTLGAPLAHASFLLVDDSSALSASEEERLKKSQHEGWLAHALSPKDRMVANVFAARVAERTLPVSPPLPENHATPDLTYDTREFGKTQKLPHHATVFAAVRWTNIHAPARNLLWGDVISGPVSPLFGPGVEDVELTGEMARSYIAHVNYWNVKNFPGDDQHLTALRRAMRLS